MFCEAASASPCDGSLKSVVGGGWNTSTAHGSGSIRCTGSFTFDLQYRSGLIKPRPNYAPSYIVSTRVLGCFDYSRSAFGCIVIGSYISGNILLY